MVVKLNRQAFEHATNLIEQGKFVFDEKDMWSEHQHLIFVDLQLRLFMTMLITLSWRVVVILGREHVL